MFTEARHSYRLWQLQRSKRRSSARYKVLYEKLKENGGTPDDLEQLSYEQFEEGTLIDDEIAGLLSQFLIQRAQDYTVPVPDYDSVNGLWEQSRFTQRWRLSAAELVKLRSAIRGERRERWEEWSRWIPIVTTFTALGGVTVAVLALLKK